MGVRLYPCTSDPAKLEALASVSHGTARRSELMARLKEHAIKLMGPSQDPDYEWHCCLSGSEVDTYESFKLFGWGKFNTDLLPDDLSHCVGATEDPCLMRELLLSSSWARLRPENRADLNKILNLAEGFCWG